MLAAAAVSGYALLWQPLASRFRGSQQVAWAAGAAIFVGELSLIAAVDGWSDARLPGSACGARRQSLRAARAHRGTPVAVRRGWRRGARVGCGSPMAGEGRPDDRLAEASGDVRHTLRGVCRVSVRRRPPRAREPRSVPRGDARERDGLLRRPRGIRGGRARLDDRRHPRDRGSGARAHAALAAEPRAARASAIWGAWRLWQAPRSRLSPSRFRSS